MSADGNLPIEQSYGPACIPGTFEIIKASTRIVVVDDHDHDHDHDDDDDGDDDGAANGSLY